MIDRLFAMWQALYPNSYVEPQKPKMNSYFYTTDDTLDANTRKISLAISARNCTLTFECYSIETLLRRLQRQLPYFRLSP
jgi:hypothetical protein